MVMRTLAIETASEACSVALFEHGVLLAHDHRVLGRGHAEQLIPMIGALPDKGCAQKVLVSLGPGSFTGVRVGLAAARALAIAWSAQVLGYPTLALVAAMARAQGHTDVTVCMNGGHGEWFVQGFDADGLALDELISATPERAMACTVCSTIAGNRAHDLDALLDKPCTIFDILPDARAALHVPGQHLSHDLAPIYGRAPDATPRNPVQHQIGKPGARTV